MLATSSVRRIAPTRRQGANLGAFSRTTNLPPPGRATLCTRRGHHHLLLGHMLGHPVVYPLLLRIAKQEEGPAEGGARLCEAGESGVGFLHLGFVVQDESADPGLRWLDLTDRENVEFVYTL